MGKRIAACIVAAALAGCGGGDKAPAKADGAAKAEANASLPVNEAAPAQADAGSKHAEAGAGDLLIVEQRRDGQATELRVGQEFGVRLDEHPSVGYSWEAVDLPAAIEERGRTRSLPPNVQPGGDRGITTFRFAAMRPGTVTLRMVKKFRGDPEGEINIRLVIR